MQLIWGNLEGEPQGELSDVVELHLGPVGWWEVSDTATSRGKEPL